MWMPASSDLPPDAILALRPGGRLRGVLRPSACRLTLPDSGRLDVTNDFFEDRQPAAEMKHRVLGDYLAMFTSKVGSTSPSGRVAYVDDGFAGPGLYDDGKLAACLGGLGPLPPQL